MRKKSRAAPFVVTAVFIVAPACSQEPIHMNPPPNPPPPEEVQIHMNPPRQPDANLHINPPGVEPPPTSTFATPPNPPKTAAVATDPAKSPPLPQAHDPRHVSKRDDGTCWEMEEEHCKPGWTCNPPPPEQVACPK